MATQEGNFESRVAGNLADVRGRIAGAAGRSGRNADDVKLVAVTKYVDADAVRILLKHGVRDLGENRIQVARPKVEALVKEMKARGARWRFIGHLQTNKAKYAVRDFAAIDAVDSLRLLEAIAREADKRGAGPVPCLVEVNVSGEAQKHGLSPNELEAFLQSASKRASCVINGLMAMAPFSATPEATSRPVFAELRGLLEQANEGGWYRGPLTELSMGMTQDYVIAVEEGATMVRVGSALYE
jgi:pyridoxal phosphate enzyme (YggS family)